jgi:SAM-dependent methyltransferase
MSSDPIEYWNGDAADRWTRHQEALDRALEPFGRAALARAQIQEGERVVDVGCGCGATVLAISDALGTSGHVTGVDISTAMLARAKERSIGRPNVSFLEADAAAYAFDRSADALVSRFGVMFFRDPVAAFRNLRRALRPGGRLAFACWRGVSENPWVTVPMNVALQHVPRPAPSDPEEPGPFAFADRARIEGILGAAGFDAVTVEAFEVDVVLSNEGVESAVEFSMTAGIVARWLVDAGEEAKDRVREGLRRELASYGTDVCVRLGGAAWIAGAPVRE